MHACTHARMPICTHMHAHTHAQTHTQHTHTHRLQVLQLDRNSLIYINSRHQVLYVVHAVLMFTDSWGIDAQYISALGNKYIIYFCYQVKEAAESMQPGIIAQTCGSYRRGKKDCGDVDILITHPDGHSEKGVFGKLIQRLKQTGELVAFDSHENKSSG